MSDFFYNRIYGAIKAFASSADLYICSLSVFAACVLATAGATLIALLSKRKKGAGKLYSFFAAAFALDLFFCLAECEFCGEIFSDFPSAYLYCFFKFAGLTVCYAALRAFLFFNKGRGERFADGTERERTSDFSARDFSERGFTAQSFRECGLKKEEDFSCSPTALALCEKGGFSAGEKMQTDIVRRLKERPEQQRAISPDLNAAYVISVALRLKKYLEKQADKSVIDDLVCELSGNVCYDGGFADLNEKLRFLVKKAAEVKMQP